MTDEPEIISNIGHNQAPTVEALREALLQAQDHALAARAERRDQFIAAARKAVIRDRQDVADAGDVIHLARRVFDDIDVDARSRRAPVREVADALKARVDTFWEPVSEAHRDLQRRIDRWMADEDKRIADQRAEQDAILGDIVGPHSNRTAPDRGAPPRTGTEPRVAPPPAAPKSRPIRGDYGGQVTRRADVDISVTDVRAVPDFILSAPAVTEAIVSVVRSMARSGAEIPGITVTPVDRTVIS